MMDLQTILAYVQAAIGIVIVANAVIMSALGMSNHSPLLHKILITGLGMWGVWFTYLGFSGDPDSPPSIAFGACIAFVLIRHSRQFLKFLSHKSEPQKASS